MKLIAHFDQHELGFTTPNDKPIDVTRRAVRSVVENETGEVAVMHFTKTDSYKLPGGGVDDDESLEAALRREVREETGYEITKVKELGTIEEDRYCWGMHQTSYCFMARIGRFIGTELTEKEALDGMELVWVASIEEAITAIESNSVLDENGDQIGHDMMKLREIAILRAAQNEKAV